MPKHQVKTVGEIKDKLRDLLHRHRQKFIKRGLTPTPENCEFAIRVPGRPPMPCPRCQAEPGKPCRLEFEFRPRYTAADLSDSFRDKANNKEWLARECRDVYMLLWAIGEGDDVDLPDAVEPITPDVPTDTNEVLYGARVDRKTGVITLVPRAR